MRRSPFIFCASIRRTACDTFLFSLPIVLNKAPIRPFAKVITPHLPTIFLRFAPATLGPPGFENKISTRYHNGVPLRGTDLSRLYFFFKKESPSVLGLISGLLRLLGAA